MLIKKQSDSIIGSSTERKIASSGTFNYDNIRIPWFSTVQISFSTYRRNIINEAIRFICAFYLSVPIAQRRIQDIKKVEGRKRE